MLLTVPRKSFSVSYITGSNPVTVDAALCVIQVNVAPCAERVDAASLPERVDVAPHAERVKRCHVLLRKVLLRSCSMSRGVYGSFLKQNVANASRNITTMQKHEQHTSPRCFF